MSIQEVSGELIEDFELFEDWADKYEYIISLGKDLQSMNVSDKTDDNIVKGCQSQVWLTARNEDGIVFFDADSDAIITKGIIALLVKVFNGQSAKDILNNDLTFIDEILPTPLKFRILRLDNPVTFIEVRFVLLYKYTFIN